MNLGAKDGATFRVSFRMEIVSSYSRTGDPAHASINVAPVGHTAPSGTLETRAAGRTTSSSAYGDSDDSGLRNEQPGELTPEEQAHVNELRARDREVRAHELAHLAAAGPHARSGASFSFETGPDGRRYAVAGEVSIDTSEVSGDPEATLAKARQVQRAAMAPAEPSAQDRRIAAEAAAMAAQASAELAQQRTAELSERYDSEPGTETPLIELVA